MNKYEVTLVTGTNSRSVQQIRGQSLQIKDGDLAIWADGSIQAAFGRGHWFSITKMPEEPEPEVITPPKDGF